MINIFYNNQKYIIKKEKIKFILEKLNNRKIKDSEISTMIKKCKLEDDYFFENVNKI